MEKRKETVSGAAERITEYVENEYLGSDIVSASLRKTRSLSSDPIFNLAAFMKYNFGGAMWGMEDKDWIEQAKQVVKILGVKIPKLEKK